MKTKKVKESSAVVGGKERIGGKSGKPSGADLAEWANEQRRVYREGRLEQWKIRKLNLVGFNWFEDANRKESLGQSGGSQNGKSAKAV